MYQNANSYVHHFRIFLLMKIRMILFGKLSWQFKIWSSIIIVYDSIFESSSLHNTKYSMISIVYKYGVRVQWVIIYLTDLDFVKFMNRMGKSLKEGGIIVIKENCCDDQAFVVDKTDSSITRSVPYLLSLLEQTNLTVITRTNQEKFPEELFPVTMIALKVKSN